MATLTNNSGRDRGIPVAHGRTVTVVRGQTIEVTDSDAEAIEKNKVASQWLKAGLITISEGEASKEPAKNRKEELIAELDKLGISKDKRSSVESLEKALDEALTAGTEDD